MGKIRVLHMIKSLDIGGIETLLINLLRNCDKDRFQFDFLIWAKNSCYYEEEAKSLGANIYRVNLSNNPIKNISVIKKFLDNEKYDVVHAHSLFFSGFLVYAAFLSGVKVRITHMHSYLDNKRNTISRKIFKCFARFLIKRYSTVYCACSKEAAKYGFGKLADSANIINNCIEVDRYINVNKEKILSLKRMHDIERNDFILGNVGRLSIEKNQEFIIKIVENLKRESGKSIKCLLIGEGDFKSHLKKLVTEKGLTNNIIFVGETTDIPEYLKLIDVFVFPSLYEGFGMALLEAQAAGIFSLSSNNVPETTDMGLGLVKYFPTDSKSISLWTKEILQYEKINIDSNTIKERIIENGFDISNTLNTLYKIYNRREY